MAGNGLNWMRDQWNDIMVQHSVYAAIVFVILAHPEFFKMVDNGLKSLGVLVPNKNVQLLVHAVVFALVMYFGTTMVLAPVASQVGQIVSGFTNKKNKNAKKKVVSGYKNKPKNAPKPSNLK